MLAGQVSDVRFDEVASRAVLQVPAPPYLPHICTVLSVWWRCVVVHPVDLHFPLTSPLLEKIHCVHIQVYAAYSLCVDQLNQTSAVSVRFDSSCAHRLSRALARPRESEISMNN